MMNELVENIVNEVSYKGIVRKQKSITRLFPDWPDKVKGIANMGGLRLKSTSPEGWYFKVHSGMKSGTWYDVHLRFKDVDEVLEKYVKDRRLWKRNKSGVDLRKLANKMLYGLDLQLNCTCPAFQYWGGAYVTSLGKYDAKYGRKEIRPPNIRNPKQYGMVCKHLQNLLNVLPFYESTMAKWLNQFYGDRIGELEEIAKKEFGWIKAAAKELGRRGEEEASEEEAPNKEEEEKVGETKKFQGRTKKMTIISVGENLYEGNTFGILSYTPSYGGVLKILSSSGKKYTYKGMSPYTYNKLEQWINHHQWGTAWQSLRRLTTVKEGKASARKQYLETGKVPEDVFELFIRKDPSRTKKYVDWMCQQYLLNPKRSIHITDVVKVFDELVKGGRELDADIYKYKDLKDVEKAVQDAEKSFGEEKSRKKAGEKHNIEDFSTKNILVLRPMDYPASKWVTSHIFKIPIDIEKRSELGFQGWCTGYSARHFKSYVEEGGNRLYYILDKRHPDDYKKKFAVQVSYGGKKTVWNINDVIIPLKKMEKILGIGK